MIPPLVSKGFKGFATSQFHLAGKLHHLVDRLFAGQARHEIFHQRAQCGLALAGVKFHENFHQHWDHHVHPTGADQGDGAVEIKQAHASVGSRNIGMQAFNRVSQIVNSLHA
jgi:hypothetical protein